MMTTDDPNKNKISTSEDILLNTKRALGADPLNREIILRLQADGRTSYISIAKEIGTSEATVRKRVNKLTEAGILRIIGVVDPVAMGYDGYALIGLNLAAGANPETIARRISKMEEVTYVMFSAGRFDLVIEIITSTHDDLRDFLINHCYNDNEISTVEPMMALALYKNLLKWGKPNVLSG